MGNRASGSPFPRKHGRLLVLEHGARWPEWLDPGQDPERTSLVAAHLDARPMSLVTEVARRIARLESRGWCLHEIVLVANERTDEEALAARSVLARGLLARLRTLRGVEGQSHLVLTIRQAAQARAQRQLSQLADALATELADGRRTTTSTTVSLRSGEVAA